MQLHGEPIPGHTWVENTFVCNRMIWNASEIWYQVIVLGKYSSFTKPPRDGAINFWPLTEGIVVKKQFVRWIVEFLHLPRRDLKVWSGLLWTIVDGFHLHWPRLVCGCCGFKSSIAWMAFFQGCLCHNGVFVAGRIDMTLLWHLSRRLCLHCSSAIDHRGQTPAVPGFLSHPHPSQFPTWLSFYFTDGQSQRQIVPGDRGLLSNETGSVLYPCVWNSCLICPCYQWITFPSGNDYQPRRVVTGATLMPDS